MRIKTVTLSWFRGASDPVALEPNCKSMVVYGCNGSGKSSFVDAVEYVLENGRIDHLAHEYSGRKYQRAVPNTHRPKGQPCAVGFTFADGSEHCVQIAHDGSATSAPSATAQMQDWEYRRTVLRQHEVSRFIHCTKGEKYSALLPLLGLGPLEVAAKNLHQLARTIEQEANLARHRASLEQVRTAKSELFGTDTVEEILQKIEELHKKYCPTPTATTDPLERCKELKDAIDARVRASSDETKRYLSLKSLAELEMKDQIASVRSANAKLADATEPLVVEKLEVLQSTTLYVDKVQDVDEVKCPACGREIGLDDLKAHLEEERVSLLGIMADFDARKAAISAICESIRTLQTTLKRPEVKAWRDAMADERLATQLEYLDSIVVEKLRASCSEDDLQRLELNLQPIIVSATEFTKDAPPDAEDLLSAKEIVDTAIAILEGEVLAARVKRAETLIRFIVSLEQGIRDEIRDQAESVIDEISTDVQDMWAILHPGEPIEDVRLYIPVDADKAIEVGLKFHGVEQESPRLTLSEGHRNSLGLCIFLAMAMREAATDRPIFLDDVVVSFDREHRGMIAEVLSKHFADRQVIIFTHDRDWFTDLKHEPALSKWDFKVLMPYDTPVIGIRWSHRTSSFDDARAQLKDWPASAGNTARRIMDTELRGVAERIQIKLRYLRGDKNDKRMAHELLQEIGSTGTKSFQQQNSGKVYDGHTAALEALKEAQAVLSSWGNRASHSDDVVRREAIKLIDKCESALDVFKCECGKFVWHANAASAEYVQCHCGKLRWRY